LDQWKTTNAQLARLALSGGDDSNSEPPAQRIAELQTRLDGLEAEISLRSAAFRAVWAPVTLEAVQAALPDDTVLIEFVVFGAFNIRAESSTEDLGPAHYAAYVIHKHGAPHGTDLGPVDAINPLIAEWREALRDATRSDLKPRTRAITDRLWRPLRAEIGDVARVVISPDGDLNLVPFEALLDQDGRYVIERHAISYLTSGRDLLRLQHPASPASPPTAPVIVAAPFFGEPPAVPPNATRSSAGRRAGAEATRDFSSLYFAPLPATESEGRAIKDLFPESTLLLGREATETAVHALTAPRILHIASHGFFVEESAPHVKIDNPLLRSGIALAGANLRHDRGDDGVLTALEASGLNLWGTKLVTLSACDTGIGEIRNGEGVYGLRRAFVLAGAESLVMTLWPVSDLVARETMTAYYRGLHHGLGRGEALRQAKLALLRRQGRQHPFFWASFIQSGQWGALD
jgi:CHAT domain-containing protein